MNSEKRIMETDSFIAKSDDGSEYTVMQFTELVKTPTASNPDSESPGPVTWMTTKGSFLKQIDPETFQVAVSNKVIRKISPEKLLRDIQLERINSFLDESSH